MPLTPNAENTLQNDKNPKIDYGCQGGFNTKATDKDIPDIIALLKKNSELKSLTINGQEITDPDSKLCNFIINHPTISSVSFYANSKIQDKHYQNDEQVYSKPIPGLDEKTAQWLNQLLEDKRTLISIKDSITTNFLSPNSTNSITIDLLSTVYANLKKMREIQAKHQKLNDHTTAITQPCLRKIFTSMKSLLTDIFSNEENFKGLKTFDREQQQNIEKIDADKTFSALEGTIKGFVQKHDGIITTPTIIKQLRPYRDFLTSITPDDKKLDLTSLATNSARLDYNIPPDSPSCDNAVQPQQ